MIRFIISAIFVILFLVLSIPVLLLLWVLGLIFPRACGLAGSRIIRWAFGILLAIAGVRMEVIGMEKVPRKQGVIYISNHQSIFDIITAYPLFPGITGYLAKKELQKIPLFAQWMKLVHCIYVDRGNKESAAKSLEMGAEELRRGYSCYIFPEGTRNKGEEDELLPFKGGAFKLAEHARCPIVPIAITGTRRIFETHFPRIKPSHVTIEFCDPIDTTGVPEGGFFTVSDTCSKVITEAIRRAKSRSEV